MGSWCYGLVRVKDYDGNKLVLSEVYFNDKKEPLFYAPLELVDVTGKGSNELLISDLHDQLETKKIWKYPEDFKTGDDDESGF